MVTGSSTNTITVSAPPYLKQVRHQLSGMEVRTQDRHSLYFKVLRGLGVGKRPMFCGTCMTVVHQWCNHVSRTTLPVTSVSVIHGAARQSLSECTVRGPEPKGMITCQACTRSLSQGTPDTPPLPLFNFKCCCCFKCKSLRRHQFYYWTAFADSSVTVHIDHMKTPVYR